MSTEIKMPKIKADTNSAAIKKWLKRPGDSVAKGDGLFSVADGKLVKTIAAEQSGVLEQILAGEGQSVVCGETVALMQEGGAASGESCGTVSLQMPKIGNAAVGTVKKWFKQPGDAVESGDMLFSMACGKLVQNVTSQWSGVLEQILVEAGSEAPCGAEVGVLSAMGGAAGSGEKKASSVAVVGGGPGGYVAAIRAAQLGAQVTLVEKNKIGGTCLNVGCIPTKALLHSAELYHQARRGGLAGVRTEGVTLDWEQVQKNRRRICDTLTGGVAALLQANGVTVVEGEAAFSGPGTLVVTGKDGARQELKPQKIILATGSAPVLPPIPGAAGNPDCITSTQVLSLDRVPASMVIVGGGVIGVEIACAYARFGTEVTIIEMLPRLLPPMDGELTEQAKALMETREGIRFLMETEVTGIEKAEQGSLVHARGKDGAELAIAAEKVLLAVGRRPDTGGLDPEAGGVETQRGRIRVNSAMETSAPNVYAIGDCNGELMLAHTAAAMGEVAAENALGGKERFDGRSAPSCVYCFPEFAGVGMTEEEARKSGKAYDVGRFPMAASGKALIMEETEGMVKILTDRQTNKILGVHILGPRATDLIAEGALAISMGATAAQLIAAIHAHPTVAESVREAALASLGRAIHIYEG